jgi:hypothetical protein
MTSVGGGIDMELVAIMRIESKRTGQFTQSTDFPYNVTYNGVSNPKISLFHASDILQAFQLKRITVLSPFLFFFYVILC